MDKRSVGWRSARPEDALEELGEYKDGWLSFLKFLKSMLICAFSHRLKKKQIRILIPPLLVVLHVTLSRVFNFSKPLSSYQ